MTDIDRRHSEGSRLEFNAPTAFVQGIKNMSSLRRLISLQKLKLLTNTY